MDGPSQLRDWRNKQRASGDKPLTLGSAGKRVGVKHSTWSEWENGSRRPGLERALSLEIATDGAVQIEAWDYDPRVIDDMRAVIALRTREAA